MQDDTILKPNEAILQARQQWQYRGQARPEFADVPGDGQESVWDFPRPPVIERVSQVLEVKQGDELIARTESGVRVLETASAPTYYFPPEDLLVPIQQVEGSSVCEWKGVAEALSLAGVVHGAWRYVRVFPEFRSIRDWLAFYPNRFHCFVGSERVAPQPGGFYGGWVTRATVGPIKGEPGSGGW